MGSEMCIRDRGYLMPTNTAEIQALLNEWGQQILTWAQSPSFLAQIGAIIAAIILAPLIARIIRMRVFLFSAPPAEDVKLLPIRRVIFTAGDFLRAFLLVILLAIFAAILKSVENLGDDGFVKLAQSLATVFLIYRACLLYTSPSPRDLSTSRMPSSA